METYKSTLDLNHELGSVGDVLNELGCANARVHWTDTKVITAIDFMYRLMATGWSIDAAGKQLLKVLDNTTNAKTTKEKEAKQASGFGYVVTIS